MSPLYLRGEVVLLAARGDKPRPWVVLRANAFRDRTRVALAACTTADNGTEVFRVPIEPSQSNGLDHRSFVMADNLATVPEERIGERIGQLADTDMLRINAALVVYLGIEGTSTISAPKAGRTDAEREAAWAARFGDAVNASRAARTPGERAALDAYLDDLDAGVEPKEASRRFHERTVSTFDP